MSVELALARIEAILEEIEALDRATGGQFRQASDLEALAVATRIEQKMLANNEGKNAPQKIEEHRILRESGHADA